METAAEGMRDAWERTGPPDLVTRGCAFRALGRDERRRHPGVARGRPVNGRKARGPIRVRCSPRTGSVGSCFAPPGVDTVCRAGSAIRRLAAPEDCACARETPRSLVSRGSPPTVRGPARCEQLSAAFRPLPVASSSSVPAPAQNRRSTPARQEHCAFVDLLSADTEFPGPDERHRITGLLVRGLTAGQPEPTNYRDSSTVRQFSRSLSISSIASTRTGGRRSEGASLRRSRGGHRPRRSVRRRGRRAWRPHR